VWLGLPLAASAPALSQSAPSPSTSSASAPVTAAGGLYVSPNNGQTVDQQAVDRYACYTWAVKESNFDPSAGGGRSEGLETYRRAMAACLEGRGYSVTPAVAPTPAAPSAPANVRYQTMPYAASSPPELKYHPFEFQIDGGYTAAVGTTDRNLSGGATGGLGLAWFPTAALPLGLRIDGSFSRLGIKDRMLSADYPGFTSGRDDVYGGDADLQFDLAHSSSRYKFYLLGGVGWYRVQTQLRETGYQSGVICGWYYCERGYFAGTVAERNTTTDWQKSWNAGVGWELAVASNTAFFIEARYRRFLASDNNSSMTLVPITFGFRF
jgi:opacity protein-like surface antigen